MRQGLIDLEEMGRGDSPLHRLDARAKAGATLVFLVAVMSFPRYEVAALTPFLIFPIVLMAQGGIPAWFLLKRVLAAAPFAVLPAVLNPFFDSHSMVVGPWTMAAGWVSLFSILFRSFLTVGAALVLVASTCVDRLTVALGRLGLPRARRSRSSSA